MTTRLEFSKATKTEAFLRSGGRCECGCGLKILGDPEYDHIVPAAIGGGNDVGNCRVMSKKCHKRKTTQEDIPQIARSTRLAEKRMGLRTKKSGFRGSRKFNGEVTWRK